jgi:hypothetical protein
MTTPTLIPITWDGFDLNPGERPDGLLMVITDVTGWYGTPEMDGHDLERALTDGRIFGAKVTTAREITLTGWASGPRDLVLALSRGLAARAAAREPATLAISEDGTTLTATVRADHDGLHHAWHGPRVLEWQLALTAADPRLYSAEEGTARLSVAGLGGTGRAYPLAFPRTYPAAILPNTARLSNPGTVGAPVTAVYAGPLDETRLSDGVRFIRVAPLVEGQTVTILTDSLVAYAPGGATRASHVLAGSLPMVAAPGETTWRLTGTGAGSVLLAWRGAWA